MNKVTAASLTGVTFKCTGVCVCVCVRVRVCDIRTNVRMCLGGSANLCVYMCAFACSVSLCVCLWICMCLGVCVRIHTVCMGVQCVVCACQSIYLATRVCK